MREGLRREQKDNHLGGISPCRGFHRKSRMPANEQRPGQVEAGKTKKFVARPKWSARAADISPPRKLEATLPVMEAAKAAAASAPIQCSPRYASVRVNAAAMQSPCAIRRPVKTARSGAATSRVVGIVSSAKLRTMPRR